jgi:hypothetical protein
VSARALVYRRRICAELISTIVFYWLALAAFPAAGEPLLVWEDFG